MMCRTLRASALVALVVLAATAAYAGGEADKSSGMDMSQMKPPAPSAEQMALNKCAGTWKASLKMNMAPGQPPMTSEGIEEVKLIEGGTWVYVQAKMPSMHFEGHAIEGWDGTKKKYVGTWVDTWSVAPMVYEGTASEDGKTVTFTATGPNMQGEMETSTMIVTHTDQDHRGWRSWKGTDTSGPPMMEMSYVRISGKSGAKGATRTSSSN